YVAGLHRSPLRGFSIEFAEHREYSPGDDLRHVDWKVFGKTDKLYLKQYEDETNLVCYLVLDTSESMRYRSANAALSKLEFGQCLVAALSWLVISQQDAVGVATFDRDLQRFIRPSSNPTHLKDIIQVLENVETRRKTNTGRVLHELAERLPKRGVVIVISDFLDDIPQVLKGLHQLRHRKHDVVVFQLLDPAELEFPFRRTTLFRGLEAAEELLIDPRAVRNTYLEELDRFLRSLEVGCRAGQVDYLKWRTDQSLEVPLVGYLARRMARVS
ncbi:MAG: DUF58 domain-containing protein, partial [Planctomycetales bacterium]|nr:DUF58 domain-containing protein [Planctomycetales bacterium]